MTQIIGTYELQEVLGAGRRTTVYRGQHRVIPGLEAAIKVLHAHLSDLPEVREQMRARAGVLARLRHPRIVRVLDFIEEGPQCALVVELSDGRTLEAQLQEGNPLALRQVLRVLRDLLEGKEPTSDFIDIPPRKITKENVDEYWADLKAKKAG